jgi:hypothetical protein
MNVPKVFIRLGDIYKAHKITIGNHIYKSRYENTNVKHHEIALSSSGRFGKKIVVISHKRNETEMKCNHYKNAE